MSERKTDTIEISGNAQYAKVAARSAEFHKDNDKCSVDTDCVLSGDTVLFTAKVTTAKGTFTGHSWVKLGGRQKQFEKQETIAVGRALAFAGYLASGDIACAEEMEDVVTQAQFNSLKKKYFKVNEGHLSGKDKPMQAKSFNSWCRTVIGEDVDYNDRDSWCREWFNDCWNSLLNDNSEIPFGE